MAVFQKKCALLLCALLLCLSVGSMAEENTSLTSLDTTYLVLASADYPLSQDYIPDGLIKLTTRRNDNKGNNANGGIYTASNTSIQLVEEAANALMEMVSDAEDGGMIFYVRQGYRSYDEEAKRYERMKDTSDAQKPGESDYQTGLAVTLVTRDWRAQTLTSEFGDTTEARWLAANCARYGFIIRYPAGKEEITGWEWEPWHLRYVGKEAATIISLNNLCLEEFLDGVGLLPERVVATPAPSEEPDDDASDSSVTVFMPFATPEVLPEGALILEDIGPDGDYDIILFHD